MPLSHSTYNGVGRGCSNSETADLFQINMALEGKMALLVVLNGGDEDVDFGIEQAVAVAIRAGKPMRAVVGDSARVPAFFKQVFVRSELCK